MPILEYFLADTAAAEAGAAYGAEALGAEALGTALATSELAGLGAAPGIAEGAQGINQAAMAADAAAGGAGAGNAGINAAQVQAQQAAAQSLTPAQQAYMEASSAANGPGISQGVKALPAYNNAFPAYGAEAATPTSTYGLNAPTVAPGTGPMDYQLSAPSSGQGIRMAPSVQGMTAPSNALYSSYQPSALEKGMNSAASWAKENPFTAMTGAYMGANALGLLNPSGATFNNAPYSGPLSKYRLSDDFKAGNANPADFQYRPRYAVGGAIPVGYDEGGTPLDAQNYAAGGSLSDSIEQYQKMLEGQRQAAPAVSHDVGIYYDQDPDTRYQDALTAAQIRQAKVNQRAYVSPPVAKRPMPMGQLQMASVKPKKQGDSGSDVEAAQGGIMHSSLGGYAAGGNPRLLKGPGDGMSDNIPATINGRQPARLADGEFVIPADVVSHLGNGSTDAGAKQLHGMMDKVRKARTGNPKQGKEINPEKYMPK
jgi:hypothetical protein